MKKFILALGAVSLLFLSHNVVAKENKPKPKPTKKVTYDQLKCDCHKDQKMASCRNPGPDWVAGAKLHYEHTLNPAPPPPASNKYQDHYTLTSKVLINAVAKVKLRRKCGANDQVRVMAYQP